MTPAAATEERLAELVAELAHLIGGLRGPELTALTTSPAVLGALVGSHEVAADVVARHRAAEQGSTTGSPPVGWTAEQRTERRAEALRRAREPDAVERRRRDAAARGTRTDPFPDDQDPT